VRHRIRLAGITRQTKFRQAVIVFECIGWTIFAIISDSYCAGANAKRLTSRIPDPDLYILSHDKFLENVVAAPFRACVTTHLRPALWCFSIVVRIKHNIVVGLVFCIDKMFIPEQ
jgi:hypothetical protein